MSFLSASFLFLLRFLPGLHHLGELLLREILISVLVVFSEDEVNLPPVETVESHAVLPLDPDWSTPGQRFIMLMRPALSTTTKLILLDSLLQEIML